MFKTLKVLALVLSFLMVLPSAVGCAVQGGQDSTPSGQNPVQNEYDNNDEAEKCKHVLTTVEAKEATCTEEGNVAYWVCSACNRT